jgi:hypothetical protein
MPAKRSTNLKEGDLDAMIASLADCSAKLKFFSKRVKGVANRAAHDHQDLL